MIRVNLLPVRKSRRRSQGRTQLFLFAGVIIIQVAMLAVVFVWMNDQLADAQADVDRLEDIVAELEDDQRALEALEAQSQELQMQLEAIQQLDDQRIGPVQMLDELQAMLSPIEDDVHLGTMHEDWNLDWEPRRVWIESFVETDDGGFSIDGRAADGDDVAEFLARMNTSDYFDQVELDYVRREGGDADLVSFELHGQLDYTGFDDDNDAEEES